MAGRCLRALNRCLCDAPKVLYVRWKACVLQFLNTVIEKIYQTCVKGLCLSFWLLSCRIWSPWWWLLSRLFTIIWKGLNWLHLIGRLPARLNSANQGFLCSFWCSLKVLQAFGSLVLTLPPGALLTSPPLRGCRGVTCLLSNFLSTKPSSPP